MLDYETNANEVSNMTAMCGMISWTGILWTSIRWNKGLKAQGIDRKTLPYMAPLQPYLSYCSFYKIQVHAGGTNFCGFQMESQFVSWSSSSAGLVPSVSSQDIRHLVPFTDLHCSAYL